MAPPVTKKQKISSADNRRLISSSTAAIGHEKQQQLMGSLVTAFGKRRSLRVAKKKNRTLTKIWICNDVLMDVLPFFGHAQLGLKLALLSPRFNALVDKHFDGKSELTIWRQINIRKAIGPKPKFSVLIDGKFVEFPLPDHSMPDKIRFKDLRIEYINQSVLEFLRSNKQIFDDGRGTNLRLDVSIYGKIHPSWDFLARQIWPIFAQNIRQLEFLNAADLAKLRRRISPTILTDHNINSIDSGFLLPDVPNVDQNNQPKKTATAGQALSNWLHTPTADGQPKQLFCAFRMISHSGLKPNAWVNIFKEQFRRATTAVSYKIQFTVHAPASMVPFELLNERTREKLTLTKPANNRWIIKRCQNGETTTAQWTDQNSNNNLNNVSIYLNGANCIWPLLSTPATRKSGRKRTSNCAEVKFN